jgi:predicted Zn-dependent peptidase
LPFFDEVVSKESGSGAAAVGVAVGAGSRFGACGEALTLKHLAFKGTSRRSDIKLARDLDAACLTPRAAVGRQTLLYGVAGDAAAVACAGLAAVAESVLKPKLVGWHVAEVQAECVAAELLAVSKDPQASCDGISRPAHNPKTFFFKK